MHSTIYIFLLLLALVHLCQLQESLVAEQGDYPFMVFLFYNGLSMYSTDGRYYRCGVLILPQWVLSSSFRLSRINGVITTQLYARAGSVIIEPEPIYGIKSDGEQDRQETSYKNLYYVKEVGLLISVRELNIKKLRDRYYEPFDHQVDKWWLTDLSIMKLISPFDVGLTVMPAKIVATDPANKICKVLIYKEIQMIMTSENGERQLQSRTVLTMDKPYCEKYVQYFDKRSMVCSYCYDLINETTTDEGFCSGSTGAPLICDGDIVAILSTVSQKRFCESPNSYHVLLQWESFIECVLREDCSSLSAMCSNKCKSLDIVLDWKNQIYSDEVMIPKDNYPMRRLNHENNQRIKNDKKTILETEQKKPYSFVMKKMSEKNEIVNKLSTTAKSKLLRSEIFKRNISHDIHKMTTHIADHYYNAEKVLDSFTSVSHYANYTKDKNLNLHRILQAMDRQSRSLVVLPLFSYFATIIYLGFICIL